MQDLTLREFAPEPMMRVAEQCVLTPKYEVIDIHNHLGDQFCAPADAWTQRPVSELLAIMDEAGIVTIIDLDGGYGDHLAAEIRHYQQPYPDRFIVFAGIDGEGFATDPNFGETEAKRLRESVAMGARGLKVWKTLGLHFRDSLGHLIPVNDERLDPLWETAAELDVPVLIHIADPVAFFQPLDRFNERYEELMEHPDWHFYPTRPHGDNAHPDFPSFEEVIDQFESLLKRHRGTTFIGAHVGCYAENLAWVGRVMDACPNFHVDFSARIAELGRQPYTARDFFIQHQDRILFGSDATPAVEMYRLHYRFLETPDEYFSYTLGETPDSGRWMIYGLDLPDDVLRKVYHANALRLLGKEVSSDSAVVH